MSSLRARYHTKLLFSPCKRCPCPCSDAVHSPSSSGLRGFVPVVLRDRWEQGRFGGPGARGLGAPGGGDTGGAGGGGGVGARDPRAYIRTPVRCIFALFNVKMVITVSEVRSCHGLPLQVQQKHIAGIPQVLVYAESSFLTL